MTSHHNSEDSLVTFLSGFNLVFLSCLLLNILVATCLGVQTTNSIDIVDIDYDFEIKTAMERTQNHSSFVAGLAILTLAAFIYVFVSSVVQNSRRLNISVLDIYIFNRQEIH